MSENEKSLEQTMPGSHIESQQPELLDIDYKKEALREDLTPEQAESFEIIADIKKNFGDALLDKRDEKNRPYSFIKSPRLLGKSKDGEINIPNKSGNFIEINPDGDNINGYYLQLLCENGVIEISAPRTIVGINMNDYKMDITPIIDRAESENEWIFTKFKASGSDEMIDYDPGRGYDRVNDGIIRAKSFRGMAPIEYANLLRELKKTKFSMTDDNVAEGLWESHDTAHESIFKRNKLRKNLISMILKKRG